jgi:hypothetical protein
MPTLEQIAWGEQLRRLQRARFLLDPVVREFSAELKRAATSRTYDERLERMRAVQDRLGEHLEIGPRPR